MQMIVDFGSTGTKISPNKNRNSRKITTKTPVIGGGTTDKKSTNRGQYIRKSESDITEYRQAELIDKFEKGEPSAFQELLANDLEQLRQQYQNIAAHEDNSGGLTTKVMEALFAGVLAKIANRSFVHWVAGTAAEVSIDYLRGARKS